MTQPIICKICNPTLGGNGCCAEHSTSGTAYFTDPQKKSMKKGMKIEKWEKELEHPINRADIHLLKDFIRQLLFQQKQEILKTITDLLNEFANTPLDKRGTGWYWLKRVKELIKNL